jgi:hypothetical protein
MSRETLKDFLSQKGLASDSISFITKESPDGLGKDPGTNQELLDLENEAEGLLGEYLKFLVDNSTNEFKIKSGNEKAASNNRGVDLTLADDQGAENIFVSQGTTLKSELNSFSNSNRFDQSGTDLTSLIDKVGKNFSNHEKLKEIQGRQRDSTGKINVSPQGDDNSIVQASQKMFKKNNRFANVNDNKQKTFVNETKDPKQFENEKNSNEGSLNISDSFGTYDKEKYNTSISKLKKLGASLLLKSSGFSGGDNPSDSADPDTISINDLSTNQINNETGFNKVDVDKLRVKNAKGFPVNSSGNSVRDGKGDNLRNDPDAENTKSFGQTYNTEFQFSNANLRLHQIEAAISLIALSKISKNFFNSFISLVREKDKIDLEQSAEAFVSENKNANVGVYMLGKSTSLPVNVISHNIFSNLLTNTTFPYANCVDRGLEVILGSSSNPDVDSVLNGKSSVGESPGFWLAISKSILKTFDQILKKYGSGKLNNIDKSSLPLVYKDIIESNKFIQFYNVMAVIGDASLMSTGGLKSKLSTLGQSPKDSNPRDVDRIPDTRAIPGKSRKNLGSRKDYKNNQLSWAQRETQSAYILPANIINAALKLNNTVYGENPARGMFGSGLIKNTYTGLDTLGSYNRIPNQVVKIIEDNLDAEYVPFYIQDLRTNEIISFHAFLSELTDNISSKFNASSGYGRLDNVQTYDSTTRSVSLKFTLISTNREDYDEMWYKINKLVTTLYPQWTPGTLVSNNNESLFYQPFSQVIGASPILRLRVGDVIKSNYSRFALARTFGIGDENVNPVPNNEFSDKVSLAGARNLRRAVTSSKIANKLTDVILKSWLLLFGSPQSTAVAAFKTFGSQWDPVSNIGKITKNVGFNAIIQGLSNVLVNGYGNPLAVNEIINQLRDPNLNEENIGISLTKGAVRRDKLQNATRRNKIINPTGGYYTNAASARFRRVFLKPNMIDGYYSPGKEGNSGKRYLVPRRLKVRILEKVIGEKPLRQGVIGYRVKVVDANAPRDINIYSDNNELIVQHSDIMPEPGELFNSSIIGAALFLGDPVSSIADSLVKLADDVTLSSGVPNEITDLFRTLYSNDTSRFMRPEVNPFVRAYETTKGRGLAGVINGGINFNWLEDSITWETDYNARAPKGCTISFKFDVIHDIPPGLDHTGYNRAPLYNVGNIMKNIAGDVYSDDGKQAEFNFRKEGGKAARVKGGKN